MKKLDINVIIILFILFQGCEKNVGESIDDEKTDCSQVQSYFTESVLPVLELNCIGCHSGTSPSAGLLLTNYSEVSPSSVVGSVLDRINRDEGQSGLMPPYSKMSEEHISVFQQFFEMECE